MKNKTKWPKLSIALASSIAAFTLLTYAAVSANQSNSNSVNASDESSALVAETEVLETEEPVTDSLTEPIVNTPVTESAAAPASEHTIEPAVETDTLTSESDAAESVAVEPGTTNDSVPVVLTNSDKKQTSDSKETKSNVTVASVVAEPNDAKKSEPVASSKQAAPAASVKVETTKTEVKPSAESHSPAVDKEIPSATAAPQNKAAKSVKVISGNSSSKPITVPKPSASSSSQSSASGSSSSAATSASGSSGSDSTIASGSSDSAPAPVAEEEYCEEEC